MGINISDEPGLVTLGLSLRTETPGSSEALLPIYENTRRHIPEDRNLDRPAHPAVGNSDLLEGVILYEP
jgi:hypothetical protein